MIGELASVKLPNKDNETKNGYWAPGWYAWRKENASVATIANVRYLMQYARKHDIKTKACLLETLERTMRASPTPAIIMGIDHPKLNVALWFSVVQMEQDYPFLWGKIKQSCANQGALDEGSLRQVKSELGLCAWLDNSQVKLVCKQLLLQDGMSLREARSLIDVYWRDEQTFQYFAFPSLDEQSLWIKAGKANISVDISLPQMRERYRRVVNYLRQAASKDNLTVMSPEAMGD
jgi:hypothetical protein